MQLKEKIKSQFSKLQFEESTHTYKVDGNIIPSTSKKITKYYRKFDTKNIAKGVAKKTGRKVKEIISEWNEIMYDACDLGHEVHLFGELYIQGKQPEIKHPQDEAIIKFWEELPDYYSPVFLELQMYHHKFMYAGTADILLLDTRDNSLVIADYKTNKDLFKQFKDQKMLGTFSFLDDTPYNHYQLQFSFYQILLEQLGYTISDRILIYLRKDKTYKIFHTKDFTDKLRKDLENENH